MIFEVPLFYRQLAECTFKASYTLKKFVEMYIHEIETGSKINVDKNRQNSSSGKKYNMRQYWVNIYRKSISLIFK